MQKHLILTGAGVLLGLATLAWLRPETPAGATVIVAGSVLLINVAGAILNLVWDFTKRSSSRRK
jgi:hypothetical protein